MADLIVTTDDLALFLEIPTADLNTPRAQLMLNLAISACTAVLSPLTDQALGTVLTVAARAYTNPQGVSAETIGPYSVQRPSAGVYLTKAERRALQQIGGRGGAFSVDPTAADAGQGLQPWGQNVTWLDGVPLAENYRSEGL